jgi:hypothetical protein
MAKVHKKTFDWRAIMNCQKHPTGRIALFFDLLIKPIITKTVTYLKDSQNLIQVCENIHFDRKPQIISLDVTALYPNIDPDIAIPIITEFITEYLDLNHINAFGFKTILELFFRNNVFRFKLTSQYVFYNNITLSEKQVLHIDDPNYTQIEISNLNKWEKFCLIICRK